MGKFAKKPPPIIRSVVEAGENHAEAWYSRPVCLGRLDLRNAYWYTQDGKRFISSRDAMEYLITMHEMVGPGKVVQPEARAIPLEVVPELPPEAPSKWKKSSERKHGSPAASSPKKKVAPPPAKKQAAQSPGIESMLSELLKQPEVRAMLLKEARSKKG